MKHRRKPSFSEGVEKKRKTHKKRITQEESGIEILKNKAKQEVVSEVIEVHGSSSEDEEPANLHGHISLKSKSRRRHSHSKKHRKERSGSKDKSSSNSQEKKHSHSERKHDKTASTKNTNRESLRKHRRKERSVSPEHKVKETDGGRVLLENFQIKEEKPDGEPKRERHRVKEESHRSRSPVVVKREHVKRETSKRRESPEARERNQREDRPRGDRGRSDQRNRRPGGPSRRRSEDRDDYEWGSRSTAPQNADTEPTEKAKPDFKLSGKLTEDRNTYNGVVIKYSEPPESRMPKKRWRLYQFKGDETMPTLYIHRQSAYLIGRDRKVADLPVDHPSCSKQHAALQYRLVTYERPDGTMGKQIRLYVIDLESANGTFINGKKIEAKKYVELMEKDVIKFGFSSREYVLLHEQSKDDEDSEDD